jgi:hypothetical protein
MNSSLVKLVPEGDFVEISALMKSWHIEFTALVNRKQPIKFDMYPMSNIPSDIKIILNRQGYQDLILENDQWQHFLISNSSNSIETSQARASTVKVIQKGAEPSLMKTGLFSK